MSNQVTVFQPGQVPAFAREAGVSDLTKSLAGGGGRAGKRISIKAGVFRLIDGGKEIGQIEERYMDIVIANAAPKIARTFYPGKFKEGEEAKPPICWSADGEKPDAEVKSPQHANCVDCPQNVKGSGDNDTRACRFSQRLAVLLANDISGDVLQLQLPSQSIFGSGEGDNRPLQSYARWLAAQKISADMVVTRAKFDTDASAPKLFFRAMRWLTNEEYAAVKEKAASDDALNAITMTVFQQDTGTAPAVALEGKKPSLAATGVEIGAVSAVVEEPKKREAKKAEPAPQVAKGDLASMIQQWASDDD